MYKSWDDVAVIEVVVVMGTKDVGWYYTGEHTPMLLMVCPTGGVQNMLAYTVCTVSCCSTTVRGGGGGGGGLTTVTYDLCILLVPPNLELCEDSARTMGNCKGLAYNIPKWLRLQADTIQELSAFSLQVYIFLANLNSHRT